MRQITSIYSRQHNTIKEIKERVIIKKVRTKEMLTIKASIINTTDATDTKVEITGDTNPDQDQDTVDIDQIVEVKVEHTHQEQEAGVQIDLEVDHKKDEK